jgi:hypothetical protein
MDQGIEYNRYGAEDTNSSYFINKFIDVTVTNVTQVRNRESIDIPLKTPAKPKNEATAELRPTLVPPPMRGLISPVWIAYGSRCYFAGRDSIIEPLFYMGNQRLQSVISVRGSWRFSPKAPYLLTSLIDYRDGKVLGLQHPFTLETTNSVYEVLNWTNIGALTIPQQFRITHYVPDTKATDVPRLAVFAVIDGVATEVLDRTEITDFSPAVSVATRVVDRRFKKETQSDQPIVYMAKAGKILNLEEMRELPALQKTHFGGAAAQRRRVSNYKVGIYASLALLFGIPLIFFAKRLWRRRT